MFSHKILPLKVCSDCFSIYHNIKKNDSRSRVKECFNLNVVEDECKRNFKISKTIGVEMAPNCFYGFYQQFDKLEQHEIILVDSGSAEIFIINANPKSDNFGEHQRIMVWKGGSVYIAPYHLFGICATKKGFRGKISFGVPFIVEHYYSYDPVLIQKTNEKFVDYRYQEIHFIERENTLKEISRSEIENLIEQ